MSRRGFVAWAALVTSGLASACGPPERTRADTGPAGPVATGPTGVTTAPPAAPSTVTSTAPADQPHLTRDQVVARYAGAAPTSWGLGADGIVRALGTRDPVVALTFDACGGPTADSAASGYDRALVDLLRQHQARATLFLNSRWIAANPATTDELVRDPLFEIGNHGTHHLPLSVTGRAAYGLPGTRSVAEAYDEVADNHENLIRLLGHAPRFFRSGTAHCDDVGVRIAGELGEVVVNFTVNGDAGATFSASQVAASLRTARSGDIIISHVNRPPGQTAEGYAVGLPQLLARGLRTVTLSEYLA